MTSAGPIEPGAASTIALMYHALAHAADRAAVVDPQYTMTPAAFREQLRIIGATGGGTSAADWLAARRTGTIVTFDDGHESDFIEALPALVAAGCTADFFVNPARVGRKPFASWTQLREMSEAGMSIQSHGYDHRYLTELAPEELRSDLRRSKAEIEDRIGRPVALVAAPGGRVPAGFSETARECGYTHVLTSRPGRVQRHATELHRLAVTAHLDAKILHEWIGGSSRAMLRAHARYVVLEMAKRVLGDRRYESLRASVLGGASH